MKKITLIFAFLSVVLACFAQQEYCDYEEARIRDRIREEYHSIVFSVVEKHAQNYAEGRNFLVSSMLGTGNNSFQTHLIIIEEDDVFRELRIRQDSLTNMEIREPNEMLRRAFNKEIYHTGTRFASDFPEKRIASAIFGSRLMTYFIFVDKDGNFYGESVSDAFTSLIDIEVYWYLLRRTVGVEMRERRWHHRFRFMRRR